MTIDVAYVAPIMGALFTFIIVMLIVVVIWSVRQK